MWALLECTGRLTPDRPIDAIRATGIRASFVTPVVMPFVEPAAMPVALPAGLEASQKSSVNFARAERQTFRASGTHVPVASIAGLAGEAVDEAVDDATYLPASQLTEWPQPRDRTFPAHDHDPGVEHADSFVAGAWGSMGSVVAVLMIDEQGEVRRVEFPGDAPEQPARQALERRLKALHFSPGRLYGRPVASRLTLELTLH